jgi:hypothetical protein
VGLGDGAEGTQLPCLRRWQVPALLLPSPFHKRAEQRVTGGCHRYAPQVETAAYAFHQLLASDYRHGAMSSQ